MNFIEKIKQDIQNPDIQTVSFDFFDTVVYRNFKIPSDLFLELSIELNNKNITNNLDNFKFLEARKNAEKKARATLTKKMAK